MISVPSAQKMWGTFHPLPENNYYSENVMFYPLRPRHDIQHMQGRGSTYSICTKGKERDINFVPLSQVLWKDSLSDCWCSKAKGKEVEHKIPFYYYFPTFGGNREGGEWREAPSLFHPFCEINFNILLLATWQNSSSRTKRLGGKGKSFVLPETKHFQRGNM